MYIGCSTIFSLIPILLVLYYMRSLKTLKSLEPNEYLSESADGLLKIFMQIKPTILLFRIFK